MYFQFKLIHIYQAALSILVKSYKFTESSFEISIGMLLKPYLWEIETQALKLTTVYFHISWIEYPIDNENRFL